MDNSQHTFAICAYKESPYLEECVKSIQKQTIQTKVIIVTSTPNEYIKKISEQYVIPLYINEGERGITQDWNFAYKMAKTDLVTIAHQDDVYLPHYTEEILKLRRNAKSPLILFTEYGELREERIVLNNNLMRIKRIMLYPLRFIMFWKSKFIRRRILSLGNPICCPAVTFVKENLPEEVFTHGFRSNEDWEAWEALSKLNGEFCYSQHVGMYHRIHEDSETSIIIGDNARTEEDYVMFCKFWPRPVAKLIAKIYATSEKSNKI